MKIGLYLYAYDPTLGGGYTFVDSIVNALGVVESRHEVFCFHYGPGKPAAIAHAFASDKEFSINIVEVQSQLKKWRHNKYISVSLCA